MTNQQTNNQRLNGTALIIALLIITVVGTFILSVGRTIVQSAYSTNRYSDSIMARSIAWAGIEAGLQKLANGDSVTGSGLTTYYPKFAEDATSMLHYQNIMRSNVSETTTLDIDGVKVIKDQLAGVGASRDFPGISQDTPILDSCGNNDECKPSDWDLSDGYYDLRVSGSDDNLDSNNRLVNMTDSDTVIEEDRGYYHITSADQVSSLPYVDGSFVDRVFDLSQYRGSDVTLGVPTDDEPVVIQRSVLYFKIKNLAVGENVGINLMVKYRDPDPNTPENENITGYNNKSYSFTDSLGGSGGSPGSRSIKFVVKGNYLIIANPAISFSSGYSVVPIPPPRSAGSNIFGSVEHLGVRFRLSSFPGIIGCARCSVDFGLRTSGNASGSLQWEPYNNSFIGTGVTKLISTGYYGNARKRVIVWAYKNVYVPLLANPAPGEEPINLRCVDYDEDISADLHICNVKIYRQNKE